MRFKKMIKIDTREHRNIFDVFNQYEKYHDLFGNSLVGDDRDLVIREYAIELKGSYDYYKILVEELQNCIEQYNVVKTALRTNMSNPVKKMHSRYNK